MQKGRKNRAHSPGVYEAHLARTSASVPRTCQRARAIPFSPAGRGTFLGVRAHFFDDIFRVSSTRSRLVWVILPRQGCVFNFQFLPFVPSTFPGRRDVRGNCIKRNEGGAPHINIDVSGDQAIILYTDLIAFRPRAWRGESGSPSHQSHRELSERAKKERKSKSQAFPRKPRSCSKSHVPLPAVLTSESPPLSPQIARMQLAARTKWSRKATNPTRFRTVSFAAEFAIQDYSG